MKVLIGPYKNYNKRTKITPDRKVSVHIDKYDTWSMDHTLALIISPMLKQLKTTKHGIPGIILPHSYCDPNTTEEENERLLSEASANWDEILDKMIWAFEQLNDKDADAEFFDHTNYNEDDDFMTNIAKIKIDKEGLDNWNAKIQEGLELFGKYFRNLWD